jgi:hypothetical protein
MTDGLAPIAIALSRHLLEHGDYVAAGTLPSEFESSRGEGLRSFIGEVVRDGSDNVEEEEGIEDVDMELGGEKEGEKEGEEKEGEEKEGEEGSGNGNGMGQRRRRKRWRDRFRVVRLDGR